MDMDRIQFPLPGEERRREERRGEERRGGGERRGKRREVLLDPSACALELQGLFTDI